MRTCWPYLVFVGLLGPLSILAQTAPGRLGEGCARCHIEALTQPTTYMSHALETIEDCTILNEHPVLETKVGKYTYRIERHSNQSLYSVTDGTTTVTLPIRWAMGASSSLGQTYLLEKDGQLFESRVSWFRELNGLGETMGYHGSPPADINEAAGRMIHQDEKLKCFGCHATHAVEGRQLALDKLQPGVQCDHCHEDTQQHMSGMLAGQPVVPKELSKLIGMTAEQSSEFCGQCHRTWAEVAMQPNPTIANIRFQPYRLTGSKCFDPDDKRISCLACHNPHHDFTGQKVNFDPKCLACHAGGKPSAKACPVAKENCVSCHMPKLDLPGAHYKFTDHRIRVVKPNEPYPG